MVLNRRGVIAALLAFGASANAQETLQCKQVRKHLGGKKRHTGSTLSSDDEVVTNIVINLGSLPAMVVEYEGETITLTPEEIMAALRPVKEKDTYPIRSYSPPWPH